ncbi:MAG TPA: hypothetical protein VKB93_06755 [Thermoanaerobaculia bacterium]|nr:hypothetical protein [Thermoanaerobaculia bacterium]
MKTSLLLCALLLAHPLAAANDCPKTMSAPLFACRNGKATAAVPELADAIYSWTVAGGTITAGAGTPRVEIALTNAAQASLTCTITTHDCTSVVTGIISVRDPLVIASISAPASVDQNAPVTLTWSYGGTTPPASQVLSGDGLPEPVVLSASERSYTFTPQSSGVKTIDLFASYATAAAATQPATGGKRRSAGRSTVGATACPDARASVSVEVRGCLVARPRINAPTSTFAGMTFDASTILGSGETAHWSATGATILFAEGDRVRLRADQEGTVKLTVRVEREPACFAESTASVGVRPRSEACPVTPSAKVELVEQTCDRATLKVTFTGRAPFRARWSDSGTPFTSSADTLTREVTKAGTYTLYDFSDDACPGTVTGAVPYERYLPGVKLETAGGKCTNAKVVAKFTGQAPFTGKWRGGEWFTTGESQLTIDNPAVGSYQLEVLRDSRCPTNDAVSETVQILQPAPVARMVDRYCQYSAPRPEVGPTVTVVFDSNMHQPPYKVWWSDGVVTSSDIPIHGRYDTSLQVGDTKTYEIARAATGQCEALVPVRTTVSSYRPPARIDTSKTQRVVCANAIGQAALSYVPPGAQLVWEVLPAGQVLSGQGTSAITYSVPQAGDVKVQATTMYADGACSSSNSYETVLCMAPSSVTDYRADSPTMKTNTSVKVRFTLGNVEGWSVIADRTGNVTLNGCTNGQCTATFTDTISQPGKVRLELHYSNHCDTHYKTAAVDVTIEP